MGSRVIHWFCLAIPLFTGAASASDIFFDWKGHIWSVEGFTMPTRNGGEPVCVAGRLGGQSEAMVVMYEDGKITIRFSNTTWDIQAKPGTGFDAVMHFKTGYEPSRAKPVKGRVTTRNMVDLEAPGEDFFEEWMGSDYMGVTLPKLGLFPLKPAGVVMSNMGPVYQAIQDCKSRIPR